MVAVPDAMPLTTPVDEPMLAVAALLLLHVPPPVRLDKVTEEPVHTTDEPRIVPADGDGSTVTVSVAETLPQLLVTV